MLKAELRKIYLAKNTSLSIIETAEHSKTIADHFFRHIDLANVKNLHTFLRIEKYNEVDTSAIYQKVWRDFPAIRTLAPRTNVATGEIESVAFGPATELHENKWGIPEPTGEATADASEFDMVIVPLLCFDARGFRVGYGKGFYDKFLKKCREDCIKVGISHFPPVGKIDDVGAHDVRLDLCVTPEEVFATDRTEKTE